MKLTIGLLSLLVCILLLPLGVATAAGSETVQATLHNVTRADVLDSIPEVIGTNDDDGHAETDEDTHADGDDEHVQASDGHEADDDHHSDQPFTWRTLLPLFVGLIGAIIASLLARMVSPRVKQIDLGIIGLIALTGVLHIVLGLAGDRLLLLNGLGYIVLLVLIYLPSPALKKFRAPLQIVLVLYTLVTIVGYFFLHSPAQYDVLALLSKAIELILIVLVIRSLSKVMSSSKGD